MSSARGGAFSKAGPCTMLTLCGSSERKRHTQHLMELARQDAKGTCVEWQDVSFQLLVLARMLLLQSYRILLLIFIDFCTVTMEECLATYLV